jgi:hypothetical protein
MERLELSSLGYLRLFRASVFGFRRPGAARARPATVWIERRYGVAPVRSRGGCRSVPCLQAFARGLSVWRARPGLAFALLLHPPLLAREGAGLVQAGPAAPFGARGDTGILLLLRECRAVSPGNGSQPRPAGPLFRGARVPRLDVQVPELFSPDDIPDLVSAPPALERGVQALPRGRAERAPRALADPPHIAPLHGLGPHARFAWFCDRHWLSITPDWRSAREAPRTLFLGYSARQGSAIRKPRSRASRPPRRLALEAALPQPLQRVLIYAQHMA